ncbi:MAG: DJ-1/PfpI family protein [Chitinispirillaceae bacterium]
MEAVTVAEMLRSEDIETTIAGLTDTAATGSHNITVIADTTLDSYLGSFDVIVLPGGMPGTTSRGVGTAIAFSRRIIRYLKDERTAEQLSQSILYHPR